LARRRRVRGCLLAPGRQGRRRELSSTGPELRNWNRKMKKALIA
jgi:hypothetical protein